MKNPESSASRGTQYTTRTDPNLEPAHIVRTANHQPSISNRGKGKKEKEKEKAQGKAEIDQTDNETYKVLTMFIIKTYKVSNWVIQKQMSIAPS